MTERSYANLAVETSDGVAEVRLVPPDFSESESDPETDVHWELGDALASIRGDNDVRVVVLTGTGEEFLVPPTASFYRSDTGRNLRTDPAWIWSAFTGIVRTHQALIEMEKPVVARVNGDAMGFGQSLVLAADLIVAVEDARFVDMHLGMGDVERDGEAIGPEYGIVPGDGGCSLVPLYMPPALATEALLLAKEFTAAELADAGVINYAVEREELDETVAELVDGLLERSPHALAWSKRVANRHVADQLNRTLDAGVGYEIATFLEQYRTDWEDVGGLR